MYPYKDYKPAIPQKSQTRHSAIHLPQTLLSVDLQHVPESILPSWSSHLCPPYTTLAYAKQSITLSDYSQTICISQYPEVHILLLPPPLHIARLPSLSRFSCPTFPYTWQKPHPTFGKSIMSLYRYHIWIKCRAQCTISLHLKPPEPRHQAEPAP